MLTFYALTTALALGVVATTFPVRTRVHWVAFCFVWIVVGTALVTTVFGISHYWSTLSFIGKLIANALTVAPAVLGSMVGVLAGRSYFSGACWQAVMGALVGLVGALIGPMIGLFAACALTSDCL